jgi:hypothetical protein
VVIKVTFLFLFFFPNLIFLSIVLAKAIEDPSMLTQAHQNTTATHNSTSIGSTIRQNIVEKLPVINTQVNYTKTIEHKSKKDLFLIDSFINQYDFKCS